MTVQAPVWDIQLSRRLQHEGRRFDLQPRLYSAAPRLVLFGPSGAGKTQTLKMLAGLARPDHGHIRLLEHTLFDSTTGTDLSPQARRLAYMFQDYALFPHLTVRQNIGFALSTGWRNPSRNTVRAQVDRWLEAFGLQALERHYPQQLSGGQKQRAALARALVAEPRALLLDEPFAALDRALRQRLREELAALQSELRIPMLLITHDEDDVRHLADEVLEISDGRMVGPAGGASAPADIREARAS